MDIVDLANPEPTKLASPAAHLEAWIEAHRVRTLNCKLADLSGLERARRSIAALAYGLLHADEVRAAGGSVPRAVLLAGPVGCGKTSLARALAGLVAGEAVFLELVAAELSPAHVAAIGRFAESQAQPVVVFVDELSWLGLDRGSRIHDADSRASLFAVLTAISGLRDPAHAPVLWLGATSDDPSELDPALTRSGRFSHVITVRRPGAATRRSHLARLLAARRTSGPIDLERIVTMTSGRTFADLDQIIDDGLSLALADDPAAGLDQAHLEEALAAEGQVDEEADVSEADRWRASVHEASHALTAATLLGSTYVRAIHLAAHPVHGRGGRTLIGFDPDDAPTEFPGDRELLARVATYLAAGIGERLVFSEASVGCADDAKRAGDMLLERIAAGMDPGWPAAWPSWPSAGPGYEDRRAAAVDATTAELAARVGALLTANRRGLEWLSHRLLAEGDLAGPPLHDALEIAVAMADAARDAA